VRGRDYSAKEDNNSITAASHDFPACGVDCWHVLAPGFTKLRAKKTLASPAAFSPPKMQCQGWRERSRCGTAVAGSCCCCCCILHNVCHVANARWTKGVSREVGGLTGSFSHVRPARLQVRHVFGESASGASSQSHEQARRAGVARAAAAGTAGLSRGWCYVHVLGDPPAVLTRQIETCVELVSVANDPSILVGWVLVGGFLWPSVCCYATPMPFLSRSREPSPSS